eukprot:c10694_g1_i1.p1 GENE.c10694_g1_i1~~c10694_g1_i1.p1  ORF type:complete len:220 (+),score=22.43 c10694_g1_i1:108-767(+)
MGDDDFPYTQSAMHVKPESPSSVDEPPWGLSSSGPTLSSRSSDLLLFPQAISAALGDPLETPSQSPHWGQDGPRLDRHVSLREQQDEQKAPYSQSPSLSPSLDFTKLEVRQQVTDNLRRRLQELTEPTTEPITKRRRSSEPLSDSEPVVMTKPPKQAQHRQPPTPRRPDRVSSSETAGADPDSGRAVRVRSGELRAIVQSIGATATTSLGTFVPQTVQV